MGDKFYLISYDSLIQNEKKPYYANLARVELEDEIVVVSEVFFYNNSNSPFEYTMDFYFRRLVPFDNGICIYPAHQKCIEEEWRKKMTERKFGQIEMFAKDEIPRSYESIVNYALSESQNLSGDKELLIDKMIVFNRIG